MSSPPPVLLFLYDRVDLHEALPCGPKSSLVMVCLILTIAVTLCVAYKYMWPAFRSRYCLSFRLLLQTCQVVLFVLCVLVSCLYAADETLGMPATIWSRLYSHVVCNINIVNYKHTEVKFCPLFFG
jgi:hypothetical protein